MKKSKNIEKSWVFYYCLFAAPFSGLALILFGVLVIQPGIWATDFEETNCTVQNYQQVEDHQCDCSEAVGSKHDECSVNYPCFLINVTYDVSEIEPDTQNVSAIVYNTAQTVHFGFECSFVPQCSRDAKKNNERVQDFLKSYGQINKTFSCFYNPDNHANVIINRNLKVKEMVLSLLFPAIMFTSSSIVLIYFFLSNPEVYCCECDHTIWM